jgi:sortase A
MRFCFHGDPQGLMRMKILSRIEGLLLIFGLLLIAVFVLAQAHRAISSRAELKRFQDLQRKHSVATSVDPGANSALSVDFSVWSTERIAAYQESLERYHDRALAVLRISKVHLEVPVFEGTGDLALNRGVGHILGTVRPGEGGNIGIAGHRDGFFRVLKDVGPGDRVELVTPSRTDSYVVDQVLLVSPEDVSVLQPRSVSSITLVTCYPFYYVGSAPERYIVQASVADGDLPNLASINGQVPKPRTRNASGAEDRAVSTRQAVQHSNQQLRMLDKEKTQ